MSAITHFRYEALRTLRNRVFYAVTLALPLVLFYGVASGQQHATFNGTRLASATGRRGQRACSIRVSQRPASVRPQVSSVRRRMHPSHPISVTTTLTQPVSPRHRPAGASWPRSCRRGCASRIVPVPGAPRPGEG
jgi:hypothetical protein